MMLLIILGKIPSVIVVETFPFSNKRGFNYISALM